MPTRVDCNAKPLHPRGTVNVCLLPSLAHSDRFPVPDADTTAPSRNYSGVSKNNDVRISEGDGSRLKRAEWPEFGRVKRQRAGDDRRSRTSDRKNRNVTNINGTEATAASAAAPSDGAGRDASSQQQLSSVREAHVAIRATRKRPTNSSKCVGEGRSRPARGSGGDGGGGSSDEKRLEPQRKRPDSVETSRDLNLGGRAYREDGPRVATVSEAVEPNWQPLGGFARAEAPVDNNRLESGVDVADDRFRRRPPYSRRSMSAHSRLEEDRRTRGSTAPALGRDGGGGGHDSSARVDRSRRSTSRMLAETASRSMPSIVCGEEVGRQRSGRGRNSILNDGREVSPELEAEQIRGCRRVKATAAGDRRPSEDRAVAASRTTVGRRIRLASSASASDIHCQALKSSTELRARVNSDSPTTPLRRAGRAVAEGQAEHSRCVDSRTFSRARVSPRAQEVADASEERNSPNESTFGDGKLYLNPWPGENPRGSGSLEMEASHFCVDNGRDGKFYLGLETDTPRSRLTNMESDYDSFREEGGNGADRTCKVEAVSVTEEVVMDEAIVELANEHTEEYLVGSLAQQRAEAARTIKKAAFAAMLRRRSARNRVDRELQRMLSAETETGEERRESRKAPLEETSGLATVDHHVLMVTGAGDAKKECAQLSAASPDDGLEVR